METVRFVEDIFPPRLLYCRVLRSPVAKGKLLSVECPKLPNTYTLLTAQDIPGINALSDTSHPVLAHDALSYIGEPVALLVGPDITRLDEIAGKCRVAAAEETPFFAGSSPPPDAVLAERHIVTGNPGAAFEQAASFAENVYRTGIQEHWYSEPVGAVACFDGAESENSEQTEGGQLAVYTATQWPHHVRRAVARALGLKENGVRVEATVVGLHMDGKLWYPSLAACHAALGAFITKKSVKLVLTKEEDFRYSPKRFASEICVKSALDDKGEVLGAEIRVTADLGAYGIQTAELLDQTCLGVLGVYNLKNLKLSGRALRTNIPPQGPFSGFGLAQGFFAAEKHAAYIADLRAKNPAEWRKENCRRRETLPLGLPVKENPPVDQLLDTAASMSDYNRKWASFELIRQSRRKNGWNDKGETLRGIGIAFGYQGSGFLYAGREKENYGVELTLDKDGSLEIKAVVNSADGDFLRIWAHTAAEILGIEAAKVRLNNGEAAPDSGPSCASRNITALTKLVERACLDIRKQRFRDPLPLTVRRRLAIRKNPLWEERLPPLDGGHLDAAGFARPAWAAAAVEIEIDQIEYTPRVRGVWLGIDGGKILSEQRARRSVKTAAIQALGWASREQVSYCKGGISRARFDSYDIPSPAEMPPIAVDFHWNDSGEVKGIGELPFTCVPAAFLQAASQALDHHFHSIPLTRDDIWEAVKSKREETPA